jgi:hypothetical protein
VLPPRTCDRCGGQRWRAADAVVRVGCIRLLLSFTGSICCTAEANKIIVSVLALLGRFWRR